MKQRITTEQVCELSSSQRIFLRGWFLAKFPITRGGNTPWVSLRPPVPLLSIGHMIEFLNENSRDLVMAKEGSWWIDLDKGDGRHDVYDMLELCDALWEAVKTKLPKKEKSK
jgi:hypothetical protein